MHNVLVVTGASVWTNPQNGTAILLVFHKALWMGDKLDHTLVNPNQLRAYSVDIQDNPFMSTSLAISDQDYVISLYSQGTIICGDTRSPTEQELGTLPRMVMTSPHDWDPRNIIFPPCSYQVQDEVNPDNKLMAVETLLQHTIYNPLTIASLISAHVHISEVNNGTRQDVPSSRTFQSKERHTMVSPADLSERWYIGLGQATETLKVTTQRLLRSAILPLAETVSH